MNVVLRPLLLGATVFCLFSGCGQSPSRVSAPSWDPDDFADAILAKLDGNGDGLVETSELAGAPGLAWGAKYIDSNNDGKLSREELVARFETYSKLRLGLTTKTLQLFHNGRPLVGAKVRLEPEFFLEGLVEPATAETEIDGSFFPQSDGVDLSGVRVGYYRVVVDSPNAKIPSKFSSADTTTAGVEISPISDDPSSYGTIKINLQGE